MRVLGAVALLVSSVGWTAPVWGQVPAAPAPQTPPAEPASPDAGPQTPHGTVLFQRHAEDQDAAPAAPPVTAAGPCKATPDAGKQPAAQAEATPDVTDRERQAVTIGGYDLVAVITPPRHALSVHAMLTLRNDGAEPLRFVPLQVSSSLRWVHAAEDVDGGRKPVALTQHCLETDADHTGAASEAILTLAEPLGPGKSATVAVDYEGTVTPDATRLTRVGASAEQAAAADWDAVGIEPASSDSAAATPAMLVGLRGFGNVLWYPVSAPQLFLGNGAELFQAAGRMKLREEAAPVRLRLTVDNGFDPAPAVVYFCGRRAALRNAAAAAGDPVPGDPPSAVGEAEFPAEPLGFRAMSLFVLPEPETLVSAGEAVSQFRSANPGATAPPVTPGESSSAGASGALDSSASVSPAVTTAAGGADEPAAADATLLAMEGARHDEEAALRAAAGSLEPLLEQWLGPRPLSALTVVNHSGQPFEDGPLVVAPAEALAVSSAAPALVHNLAHAWVQTGQPWMDEGLAQFFSLLETERARSRSAALAQLTEMMQPVAMADATPTGNAGAPTATDGGQPLIRATDEFFFRRKAAAVWWMLRDIAGPDDLRRALEAWRVQPVSSASPSEQAQAFEKLLERLGHKDLQWFFDDWVLHDRGLPDLSIADVNAHPLDASNGTRRGWLVTVTVHNDGAAQAEVPLEVRAGAYGNTRRIRVPALGNVTERMELGSTPTEVKVNDGSVPEVQASVHTKTVSVNVR